MQPVAVTMQPLQRSQQPPVPVRWSEAVSNVEAAQRTLDDLTKQLDGALYLDDEAWQHAVPHAQFTAALHSQHRKIQELEGQLQAVVARLEESERGRRAAESRCQQLQEELDNNSSVFKLHYEELLRREEEIKDLQAVISALSLGGSGGGKGGSRSGGKHGSGSGSGGALAGLAAAGVGGGGSDDGDDDELASTGGEGLSDDDFDSGAGSGSDLT